MPASAACAREMSVLVVHEQHLQSMGCDTRLLGIVRALLSCGHKVSLFFRTRTPEQRRNPPTKELASLLHIPRAYNEEDLRRDVRELPPPAIYERTTSAQMGRLFAQGWFNAAIVSFWFWHDPKPNVAELVLPQLHTFSPAHRRPFVAILSDDAHALRDKRLASWEQHEGLRANFSARALAHVERQRRVYPLADLMLHLTKADSDAERALFPSVRRWGLLRLSLQDIESELAPAIAAAAIGRTPAAQSQRSTPSAALRIGFLGNGQASAL